jgi:hypothetical protein
MSGSGCDIVLVQGRNVLETVTCARQAGHAGRCSVQWNEDDERREHDPPAPSPMDDEVLTSWMLGSG